MKVILTSTIRHHLRFNTPNFGVLSMSSSLNETEKNDKSGFLAASVFFTTLGILSIFALVISDGDYIGYAILAIILFFFAIAFFFISHSSFKA